MWQVNVRRGRGWLVLVLAASSFIVVPGASASTTFFGVLRDAAVQVDRLAPRIDLVPGRFSAVQIVDTTALWTPTVRRLFATGVVRAVVDPRTGAIDLAVSDQASWLDRVIIAGFVRSSPVAVRPVERPGRLTGPWVTTRSPVSRAELERIWERLRETA